jgi:glycyl-tRNA synthetase beta chain
MPAEFFLEIGCEEIPARTMARALDDIRERLRRMLEENKLAFDSVEAFGSARRFVLRVPGLAERQEPRKELTMGPPVRIAFNDGQPSPALQGFARKNNIAIEALQKFSTDRGEYFGFQTTVEGRPAFEILSNSIPEIVRSMTFPKTMVWMDPAQRFARPVRWLIARHGDRSVPVELFGVKSGNRTEGHRVLGSGSVEVWSFADLVTKLEQNFVIVSQEERKRKIESELKAEALQLGAKIIGDERLLEEVVYINEYPTVVRGHFEERFLVLPREILITVMREHQKYFGLENENGDLLPHFLAVMNMASDSRGLIRKGNERVLRARLSDAMFFWEMDAKHSLEERRSRLKSIVFQERLGTYAAKVKRVLRLAKKLNALTKAKVNRASLEKAVTWSKSDLTTDMVREFTDLQGVVGGLYAKREGAPEDVWKAIYDQYRPQSLDDQSPSTKTGAVLSIADRLDTLFGCFSVGLIPTGSEDPLGLRRQMQGVIKILLDHHFPFSFRKAAEAGKASTPELNTFYEDRLRFILGQRGFAYDEINAVVAIGCDNPSQTLERVEAIHRIRQSPDFEAIAIAFKRIKNILRQAEKAGESLDDELSTGNMEPAENDLLALLQSIEPKFERLERGGKYLKILETMASARPVIDRFFDKILVMHQDPQVRARRLALLNRLFKAFSRVADISEIVVPGA